MRPYASNILAIIPARGGSKRLSGKNVRPLGGRPLLAYSILTARACPAIQRVAVSSDADDILEVAREWGAEAIRRPQHLADDFATTVSAMQHALLACEDLLYGYGDSPGRESPCLYKDPPWKADHVALFQATCPLRRVADVNRAIGEFVAAEADSALTVTELHLKAGRRDAEGWYRPQYKVGARKQDIEPLYQENGAFYLTRADLIRRGELFGPRTLLLDFPPEAGIASIDTEFDFCFTEALFHRFGYETEFSQIERDLQRRPYRAGRPAA